MRRWSQMRLNSREEVIGLRQKKMAQAFCNWKKKLNTKFIKKEETPDWDLQMYMKLKEDWPAFKAYKLSEEAKARSAKNAENAKKKKYKDRESVV